MRTYLLMLPHTHTAAVAVASSCGCKFGSRFRPHGIYGIWAGSRESQPAERQTAAAGTAPHTRARGDATRGRGPGSRWRVGRLEDRRVRRRGVVTCLFCVCNGCDHIHGMKRNNIASNLLLTRVGTTCATTRNTVHASYCTCVHPISTVSSGFLSYRTI